MGYYNKTKVIASTSGRPIIGSVVLVTDVEPTERVNGDALVIGDAWWSPATNILSNYLPDDQGVYGWVSVDAQLIIVSDTEPTSRTNGDDLSIGDAWWDPATTTLRNYLPNEDGDFSWVGVDGSDDLGNYYTKEEVDTALESYFTKEEVGTELEVYYTKEEVDTELESYYTKEEVDVLLTDFYTSDEVDTKLTAESLRTSLGIESCIDDAEAERDGVGAGEMYFNTTSNKYVLRA